MVYIKAILQKIISGGRTGVDRAGLDVAIELASLTADGSPKAVRLKTGPCRTGTMFRKCPQGAIPHSPSRTSSIRTGRSFCPTAS